MKIIFTIVLMNIFIFVMGALFADRELEVYNTIDKDFHLDRYGYYWAVEE